MFKDQEELRRILPNDGPSTEEVSKYIEKYNNEIIIIKCGGSVLLDKTLFNQFIEDLSIIYKLKLSVVVIHGGGKNIKQKLDQNNLTTKFIDGLRVTDKFTIKLVEEALLDLNDEIIDKLKKSKAIGNSITPKKNNIIYVKPEREELGFVGTPTKISEDEILENIKQGKISIIAPLGLDESNCLYNINADIVAGAIAKKLKARRLLLMTDVEGVLDENGKLLTEINTDKTLELLKKKVITGGMIPKINTCLDAISNGVRGVVIVDGRKPHSILFELFSDKGAGTLIRK